MTIHTLGTAASTSLKSLAAWASSIADADIAAIGETIVADHNIAAPLGGVGATAVMATGTTHSNATLDTLVTSAGAPLAQIQVGDRVIGVGIPPGTFVAKINSATAVTLSQAATASAAGVYIAFVRGGRGTPMFDRQGLLHVPGRGILKVLPGDYVAIDNTGWPILVSGPAVAYAGSLWSFS